ncbi:hypothetical protein [Aquimarina sp. 2304DJ70-9]|uniref:hypothetical protein n=1 Tax=Aquimarina penaris TaxID=3231044 RepID=UPI0034630F91
MPIKINQYTPAEFPDGKEPVVEKFLKLIFDNVENYEEFQLHTLRSKLGLTDNEKRQFNEVLDILRSKLKKNERIEIISGTLLRMLPAENLNSQPNINIENFIGGDNNGIQSSKSDFSDVNVKNNYQELNQETEKESLLRRIFLNPYVIGLIFVIIAAIFNAERIMNFINKIINDI